MLVLARRTGQAIGIECPVTGRRIMVRVNKIAGEYVSLAFDAPADVMIYREEVWRAIDREAKEAARNER